MRGSVRRLLLDRACCQRRWCKQEKEEKEEEEVWCAQLPPSGPEHHRTRLARRAKLRVTLDRCCG